MIGFMPGSGRVDEFIIYKSIMIAKSYADAQLMQMTMQNARWFQRALGAFTWLSVHRLPNSVKRAWQGVRPQTVLIRQRPRNKARRLV